MGKPETHERASIVLVHRHRLKFAQWLTSPFLRFHVLYLLTLRLNCLLRGLVDVILAATRLPSLFCRRPLFFLTLAPPRARLSLISRHLEQRPQLEINTPFSTERLSREPDDVDYTPIKRDPPRPTLPEEKQKMAQTDHPALLIPGPIEFDDVVLQSMGHFRFGCDCEKPGGMQLKPL